MAYDEHLAVAVRDLVAARPDITERKMFGGVCFFLNGNMLCGVEVGRYMFRVGKENEARALSRPGASPMDLTGRPMGGLVHVNAKNCSGTDLEEWLALACEYVREIPAKRPKLTLQKS